MATTKYVNCKVFNSLVEGFQYPELNCPEIIQKNNVGIAFSGGGTRSASLTMGQLRAMDKIGILENIRYLSAVSGGSWGSLPFMFLDNAISDEHYYRPYLEPEDITIENLKECPNNCLTYAISNSKILDKFFKEIFAGDERYSRIISDIFLGPFNLGNYKKFFTYNEESLNDILNRNKNLSKDIFYLVNKRKNRPFPIAGGTILRPGFKRYPFEMTPLYVGINQLYKKAGSDKKFDIGGGYIEPFGFNSDAPLTFSKQSQEANVRLGRWPQMFTLGDVIGTSGAAPAEYADRLKLDFLGFPEFKYWCPAKAANRTRAKEYDFGDGGILENLGIMPLIRRKVKKMIIFVNGSTPLEIKSTGSISVSSSIPALFHLIPNQNGEKGFSENIIFANQEEKFDKLVNTLLQKKTNGESAIFSDIYLVTDQPCHGIKGGFEIEILWIYNDIAKNWIEQLPIDIKIRLEKNEFGKHFPHYSTFMENFPNIIDLRPEQANLAAHLSAWNVIRNKDLIIDFVNSSK